MTYISIDGDDVGRKITSLYLRNDDIGLEKLSGALKLATEAISELLSKNGFNIIFCAADGVVASTDVKTNFDNIFREIVDLAPNDITFSAGIGSNLKEAYIALLSAKSNGKNCLHDYHKLETESRETSNV